MTMRSSGVVNSRGPTMRSRRVSSTPGRPVWARRRAGDRVFGGLHDALLARAEEPARSPAPPVSSPALPARSGVDGGEPLGPGPLGGAPGRCRRTRGGRSGSCRRHPTNRSSASSVRTPRKPGSHESSTTPTTSCPATVKRHRRRPRPPVRSARRRRRCRPMPGSSSVCGGRERRDRHPLRPAKCFRYWPSVASTTGRPCAARRTRPPSRRRGSAVDQPQHGAAAVAALDQILERHERAVLGGVRR